MNSHRDEQMCVVDPGSDGRPEIFDRLLDASSLGAPDMLRHEAMTPPSFFAELDAALDEEYASQAKDQPAAQNREGDVDDALLRLVERAAQPIASTDTADPNSGSSRPTWTYPSGSFAVSTFLRPLHETDLAGEQHIRLWYLPAADSRVFVSFVEYERPSRVRALLSALLPTSQEEPPSEESDWNLNVFSNLREDIAREILAVGLDSQPHFESIVQACSSAIVASHISDAFERYLHSSGVSAGPELTKPPDRLAFFRRVRAELGPGVVRPALESSERIKFRTWTSLLRAASRKPDEQWTANASTIPIQLHRGIEQPESQHDLVWVATASGKTHTLIQAECKTLSTDRDAVALSERRRMAESAAGPLWICVRDADDRSPSLLLVVPLTSAEPGALPWLLDLGDPLRPANRFEVLEAPGLGRYNTRWAVSNAVRSFHLSCSCNVTSPGRSRIEEAMPRPHISHQGTQVPGKSR